MPEPTDSSFNRTSASQAAADVRRQDNYYHPLSQTEINRLLCCLNHSVLTSCTMTVVGSHICIHWCNRHGGIPDELKQVDVAGQSKWVSHLGFSVPETQSLPIHFRDDSHDRTVRHFMYFLLDLSWPETSISILGISKTGEEGNSTRTHEWSNKVLVSSSRRYGQIDEHVSI